MALKWSCPRNHGGTPTSTNPTNEIRTLANDVAVLKKTLTSCKNINFANITQSLYFLVTKRTNEINGNFLCFYRVK